MKKLLILLCIAYSLDLAAQQRIRHRGDYRGTNCHRIKITSNAYYYPRDFYYWMRSPAVRCGPIMGNCRPVYGWRPFWNGIAFVNRWVIISWRW
jgi:hypothetical protein